MSFFFRFECFSETYADEITIVPYFHIIRCAIFGVDTIKAVIASEVEREAEMQQGGAKRFVVPSSPSSIRSSTTPTSPHSPSAVSVPYFSHTPSESYPVTVRLEDAELDADAEGEYEYDFSAEAGEEWDGDEDAMCVSYSDEEDEDEDEEDGCGMSDADSDVEYESDEDEFLPADVKWEDSRVQVDGDAPILEVSNSESNASGKEDTFDIDQAVAKIQSQASKVSKSNHSQNSASSPHHHGHGHRKSKMKGEGAFRLDLPEGVDRASLAEESAAKGAKEITFRASPPLSPTSPPSPSSSCSSSFSPTPSPSPTSPSFAAGEGGGYASENQFSSEYGFDGGSMQPAQVFRWSHIPAPCLREPMHPIEGKGTPGKGRGWEDWARVARGEQLETFESRPPLSSRFSSSSSSSSGDNDIDGIPNAPGAGAISQEGAVMQGDPVVPSATLPMAHPQQQIIQIQIPEHHPHEHQEQALQQQQQTQLDLASGAYADIHLVDAFVEQVNSGNYTGQSDAGLGPGLSTLSGGQDAMYVAASSPVGLDVAIGHTEMPMTGVSSPCGTGTDAHHLPSSSSSSPSPSPSSPSSPQMNAVPTQENMLYGLVGFNLGVGVGMTMGVNVGVGVGMGVGMGVGLGMGMGMNMNMNMNMGGMGGMGMGSPTMSTMGSMGGPMDMSMPMSMESDFSFAPHNMNLGGLTSPLSPLSPISPMSPLGIATLDSGPISVGHSANAGTGPGTGTGGGGGLFDAYDGAGLQSHLVHSPHHSPALGTVEFGNVFGNEAAGPAGADGVGVGVGLSPVASPELTPLAGHVEA